MVAARTHTLLVLVALAGTACGAVGGIVSGPPDTHCGDTVVAVDADTCEAGDGQPDVYGDTLYNSDGQDDGCKYHLSFTNSTIQRNEDVRFVVSAWALDGGATVTGAQVRVEASLDDGGSHPAPPTGTLTTEGPPGTYAIGPVQFDKPGRWTVRFHLFEDCAPGAESPHGHAAFYVDVP